MSTRKPLDDQDGWIPSLVLYLAVAGLVSFAWLGSTDVISMEGIVADGAREMVRSGDWLVPRLYGETYNFKPPMAYWLALASFETFGRENAWTLRLPFGLCGVAMGLVVLICVGRIAGPRRGCVCALASLTTVIAFQKMRLAEFDAPLAAGVGAATAIACAILAGERKHTNAWLIAYAALCFAMLAKGLAVVMFFVPGLILAGVLAGRRDYLRTREHLTGAALLIAVALAYGAALLARGDPEALAQPLREALYRGAAWGPKKLLLGLAKPAILVAVFLPWGALLGLALDRKWRAGLTPEVRRLLVTAAAFLIGGLAVYMLVPTHKTRYFVPLSVAMGIIVGLIVTAAVDASGRWGRLRRMAVLIAAAACGVLAVAAGVQTALYAGPMLHRAALIALGLAALAAAILEWRRAGTLQPASLLISAGLACWACVALVDQPRRAEERTLRSVAARFAPTIDPKETVWVDMGDDHSSLVFYLDREVQTFESEENWPKEGSLMILLSPEMEALAVDPAYRAETITRTRGADTDFTLCRLVPRR